MTFARRTRITALDVQRFTEGDCHFLARAIHLRTGWPMVAFNRGGPDLHAFVLMPDGRALDVQGACPTAIMARRWRTKMKIATFSWQELRVFGPPDFGPYSYRRAHILADRLLAEVGFA